MKVNDAIWGALLLLLAAALLVHIQSFPTIPGQKYGPALMPGLIGVGFAVCGALLVFKGLAARRGGENAHWVRFGAWTRVPGRLLALVVAIGVNVFYVVAVARLGFIVTATIYLAALFVVFGVRPRYVMPIALIVVLAIHYIFYKLLRVPLPWGVLQPIAW
jgi:putative tricarboxylic transport membrane protein